MISALLLGVSYALLMLLLGLNGHQPSMDKGLPVSGEHYYLVAAFYITPLCVGLTWLFARVTGSVAGVPLARDALMRAYAIPLCAAHVLVDMLSYQIGGFEALGQTVRYSGPLAIIWLFYAAFRALHAEGVPQGRAALAIFVGLVAQGIPAALLIR